MATQLKRTVRQYFNEKNTLSKKELAEAISSNFPKWADSTITTRIHELKQEGVIHQVARGLYSIIDKKSYLPEISSSLKRVHNKVKREFPYAIFCVWDTKWLNEFMLHQQFRHYQVIEVEKDAMDSVFNAISDLSKKAFLNPDSKIFEKYVANHEEAIIIKPLITESPIDKTNGVYTPFLEKLMVDMLIERDLFSAQQGEIEFIYGTALDKYSLNKHMMQRYARRRNQLESVRVLFSKTLANLN